MTIDQILVIPCYNEELRFQSECFANALLGSPNLGLLFVNDGSRDATEAVLDRFVTEHPDRTMRLSLPKNCGKAEAVRQGFIWAFQKESALASRPWKNEELRYIGYWDCDLATPLTELPQFRDVFSSKPEISLVMGARIKLMGRRISRHAYRHYLGRIFATAASWVLKLPVYDTQCGAKLFRYEETTAYLFQSPFISSWIFDVEILARLSQDFAQRRLCPLRSGTIYELPLREWKDIDGSKVRPIDFLKAFASLIRIARVYQHPKTLGKG